MRYGLVPESGNCIPDDEQLFTRPDMVDEAIALCEACPVLAACRERIGTVALGNLWDDEGVIAGKYYRWRIDKSEQYRGDIEDIGPYPTDAPSTLAAMRLAIRRDNVAGAYEIGKGLRPRFDALKEAYEQRGSHGFDIALGDVLYKKAWKGFGAGMRMYRLGRGEVKRTFEDVDQLCDVADIFFGDIVRFAGMKWEERRVVGLALRQPPDDIRALFEKYESHPDVSPTYLRLLIAHDTTMPQRAIDDYLLRLQVVREQFKGKLPDSMIKLACATSETVICVKTLARWHNTYKELAQQPQYRQYEDWLLRYAAGLSPASRQKRLGKWNTFFRTKYFEVSLDATRGHTSLSLHGSVADGGISIEESFVQRETILGLVDGLAVAERDAVLWAYDLSVLLGEDPPEEDVLRKALGTDDVAAYVEAIILPKVRNSSTAD
jgi:hypothetical protein